MPSNAVERTFLVELYRPDLGVGSLERCVTEVRDCLWASARHGSSATFLCSVIVPDDEAFLVLVRAESEQHVEEAFGRAGVPFDRISAVIAEVVPPTSPSRGQ